MKTVVVLNVSEAIAKGDRMVTRSSGFESESFNDKLDTKTYHSQK